MCQGIVFLAWSFWLPGGNQSVPTVLGAKEKQWLGSSLITFYVRHLVVKCDIYIPIDEYRLAESDQGYFT
jgi:hypothetical protein